MDCWIIAESRLRRIRPIPEDIDYAEVTGLSTESREKLQRFRPMTVGQASRISGVTPSDMSVLMVHLERRRGNRMAISS